MWNILCFEKFGWKWKHKNGIMDKSCLQCVYVWSVGWTKQEIWRCPLGLWEIVMGMFHSHFIDWTNNKWIFFKNQHISQQWKYSLVLALERLTDWIIRQQEDEWEWIVQWQQWMNVGVEIAVCITDDTPQQVCNSCCISEVVPRRKVQWQSSLDKSEKTFLIELVFKTH